ncbi:hypothetical protein ENSA5_00070 [Enhygromyxa salina]|uniref:IgGFc-binding protein N-terminal domain-containing protein n=1 Tax=Enhygromyxa salina TaxID=215803 RepID=A0A2S9YLH2_9BACT|nr:hypothetical protein [Enhygromyxa salina]PRQ05896.1 hypothetical protein ENSA5_00070 [Enhygromyxa salina]
MMRRPTLGWFALALAALGCQAQEEVDIPNRVLDRPTDMALVCAAVECEDLDDDGVDDPGECTTVALPLSVCQSEASSCSSDNPHLVGFVANSERNEIAMFTKCANRLVDMDIESPGYNFIPAGILPTELDASSDGCRVISANVGSCDLTLLDAPALAGFGLDNPDVADEPSSLVSTVIPHAYVEPNGSEPDAPSGWVPLGARPGQVLSVPSSLTQSPGLAPGQTLTGICDPLAPASVYVSFPTCNMVAEVDLKTGYVIQSRQFVTDEDGVVNVVDSGPSPTCPLECPGQFNGDFPPELPQIDSDGPFPQALALALRPSADDEDIQGQQLYVGGLGSDVLFEIPIEDSGEWAADTNQLELDDAGGIKGIRVSPKVDVGIEQFSTASRFLYIVAGDGSTRVVGRALPADANEIGVECETHSDPSVVASAGVSACTPVSQSPNDVPPTDRRGFARGPGIRPGRGEEVTDWMFRKTVEEDLNIEVGDTTVLGPFSEPGTVAIGVTTGGYATYVMIDQERANGETTAEDLGGVGIDPANVMDVRLFPHSLWPDPGFSDELGLPTVFDDPPSRVIPADSGPTRSLAPTLRRVDATYANDERAFDQLNVVADYDGLGNGVLYDEDVVRVAVHDYRSWGSSSGAQWSIEWEGSIPNTLSSTGRVDCDKPGWYDGTCLEGSRLYDASANFCDEGVLPDDKLVIVGCFDDDDCGDGRACLRETAAGGDSTGICISAEDFDERAAELRQICDNFIRDPCGEAYREFRIVSATQTELELEALPPKPLSQLVEFDDPDGGLVLGEVEGHFVCTDEQPDGGCGEDSDCMTEGALCIDARCRVACDPDDPMDQTCIRRRLPGPECFGEFVRYQVALNDEFRVSGPGITFVTDLVEADEDGYCRETTNTEISRLLTSRLPLPPSDDPDDPEWQAIPACVSDNVEPSNANPCRVTATRALNNKFHQFVYEDQVSVSALRYSNPIFSIVLDLASLEGLTADIPGYEDVAWPAEFAGFRRSRIPRGYRQDFGLDTGYAAFADFLLLEGQPLTYPVRIVAGPQTDVAYIVDGSGPGSTSSIRGQVVRVTLGDSVMADETFTGVR